MNLVLATAYGLDRALPEANHTSLAFLRVDIIRDERFADIGRATFLFNVGQVFVPEVFQSGQYRIGGRGTQRT